jgi:hypothetical protein
MSSRQDLGSTQPPIQWVPGVKLTTYIQLVPRSRKCGFIHPFPHAPSWRSAQLVMVWTTVPFYWATFLVTFQTKISFPFCVIFVSICGCSSPLKPWESFLFTVNDSNCWCHTKLLSGCSLANASVHKSKVPFICSVWNFSFNYSFSFFCFELSQFFFI